ncbi:MAG TPA: sulfotransferase [Polyangiaceae bacterium]|nr:sulfotransferase [Polyangiaceae bacterium]
MNLFAVLGMHRSGTSLVSRILNLLGATLGPEDDLMPPKPDNPTGFWESLTVTQIHDDLFAELGGRWDRPPVLAEGWETAEKLDPFVNRIRAVVESHFAGAELAAWKDPRGSFFIPLWRRVVPVAGTVLCLRDPDEIVGSLAAREGMDPERAAALFLRYVVAAFHSDGGHLLVRFDDAHAAPRELAVRLAAFVGAPPPDEETLRRVSEFVNPSLRHHGVSQVERGPILRLARATHALVTRESREVVAPFLSLLADRFLLEARLRGSGGEPAPLSAAAPDLALAIPGVLDALG